ncbi:MAG TPA: hypothetical protein VF014_11675 [Casimicrobiaceae bacterium]|nr:hypothetical protein [Casimicrobiaceae bacterium]
MIALVTLRFGARAYFELSQAQYERYAAHHGYALHVGNGAGLPDERDRRWGKVPALLAALEAGADLVLYLDADCVLVDESLPLTELVPLLDGRDLLVGRDSWWNANTGAMLVTPKARDILEAWHAVPLHDAETAHTWPVDELGFNRHILPRFADRISCPRRVVGTPTDLVTGPFVRHCMNGSEAQKRATMLAALSPRS